MQVDFWRDISLYPVKNAQSKFYSLNCLHLVRRIVSAAALDLRACGNSCDSKSATTIASMCCSNTQQLCQRVCVTVTILEMLEIYCCAD